MHTARTGIRMSPDEALRNARADGELDAPRGERLVGAAEHRLVELEVRLGALLGELARST